MDAYKLVQKVLLKRGSSTIVTSPSVSLMCRHVILWGAALQPIVSVDINTTTDLINGVVDLMILV